MEKKFSYINSLAEVIDIREYQKKSSYSIINQGRAYVQNLNNQINKKDYLKDLMLNKSDNLVIFDFINKIILKN